MSIESVMPPSISPSVIPFCSFLQSFPESGSFPRSQFFTSGGQSIRISPSASVLPARLTTGTSGTRSGGLRKGQSPCEFLGGLSGFLSRRCSGLRPCVESVPEPEDSSPVLTWILGYFWILPRGVSRCLENDFSLVQSLSRVGL